MTPCPHCHEPAEDPEARYCEACGRPMRPGVTVAAPKAPAASRSAPIGSAVCPGLAVASDEGMRHPDNQDAGAVSRRPDGLTLLVVADGVSSSDRPEEASRVAVEAVRAAFGDGDASDLAALARGCVGAASAAVRAVARHDLSDDLDPPETTVVLAVVRGADAAVAWVGDSRAYLLADDGEVRLTTDDSWAAEVVAAGTMTREAAMRDARAHAITQCLGMPDAEVDVHVAPVTLPAGASLLLCSDGLWNYADEDGAVARLAARGDGSEDALATCRRLVAHANACGGRDNVTVALLRPDGTDAPR